MQMVSAVAVLFSVLVPTKMWYAPGQPMTVQVKSTEPVVLRMTEFLGKSVEPDGSPEVQPDGQVDLKKLFPQCGRPGTYVLWAVPKDKPLSAFVGTPLVISVRADRRPGANPNDPLVSRVEPLRYGVLSTDHGPITLAFYYDLAPNTVGIMQQLAGEGFYDGLTFHRIVPGFLIQGGDPVGSGLGGPGFNLPPEFSDRKHEAGTVSMARATDPLEAQGLEPRCEYANSGGSQFFICLAEARRLDGRYTVVARVVDGMEAVNAIAQAPRSARVEDRPESPQVIHRFQIKPVTASENPYRAIMTIQEEVPATQAK